MLYLTSDERSKKYKKSEDRLSQGRPKTDYYKYNTKRCLITNEYSETNTLHIYNDQIRSIKEAWYTTGDKK